MLKLGKNVFEENLNTRDSSLMFFKRNDEEPPRWSLDCNFFPGKYQDEMIAPSICINPIETTKSSYNELIGERFLVSTIEECDTREDSFYIFEHEPMIQYEIEIMDIQNQKAYVKCTGTAIVDGYAASLDTEKFSFECWLPIRICNR